MKNIPKKIHFIWFGPREPNIIYLDEIKETYPDYEVKIWREEDFDLEDSNAFVKYAYDKKKWSFVSDYYRMKVLFEEGGIYLDTDMEPINKFDIDNDADLFLGYEYRNNITMGFIASKPGHMFTKRVMEYYESMVKPGFLPLGNLVWTELLYELYPTLGVCNKNKRIDDVQVMDRNAFGLWSPNRKESFFIHRHTIDWIDSRFIKWMIHTSARFAKLTPAFVENILVVHQRRMTRNKSISNYDKKKRELVLHDGDVDMMPKELFNEIVNKDGFVRVKLNSKNKKLKKELLNIYNVKSVSLGKNKINMNYKMIEVSKNRFRSQLETKTNIYNYKVN